MNCSVTRQCPKKIEQAFVSTERRVSRGACSKTQVTQVYIRFYRRWLSPVTCVISKKKVSFVLLLGKKSNSLDIHPRSIGEELYNPRSVMCLFRRAQNVINVNNVNIPMMRLRLAAAPTQSFHQTSRSDEKQNKEARCLFSCVASLEGRPIKLRQKQARRKEAP